MQNHYIVTDATNTDAGAHYNYTRLFKWENNRWKRVDTLTFHIYANPTNTRGPSLSQAAAWVRKRLPGAVVEVSDVWPSTPPKMQRDS